MPILVQRETDRSGILGIWKIEEDLSFFSEKLHLYPEEAQQYALLKGRRRIEWLAVRWLLHQLSGRTTRAACLKDAFGKPYLVDSNAHISMSHSHELVCVFAASAPVGVDVQVIVPKIERIAPKFMHRAELDALDQNDRIAALHVYWSAKECLYKAYGRKQLTFNEHIRIRPFIFKPEGFVLSAYIHKEDYHRSFKLWAEQLGSYIFVYAIQETRHD